MKKIMIVDDEALVRIGLQSIMDWQACGYEIVGVYSDGSDAWAAIQQGITPDVLLTDIRMPDMDGFELIRHVKSKHQDMNIVILSSYEDFEYTRKAIQLNVQDYIVKYRLEPEELLRVMESLSYPLANPVEADSPLENARTHLLKRTRSCDSLNAKELHELSSTVLSRVQHAKQYVWLAISPELGKHYLEEEQKAFSVFIQETMDRLPNACCLGMDELCIHGLIWFEHLSERDFLHEIHYTVDEVVQTVRDALDIQLIIGISHSEYELQKLAKSRREAEQALKLFFYHGEHLVISMSAPQAAFRTFSENESIMNYKKIKEWIRDEKLETLPHEMMQIVRNSSGFLLPAEAIRLCRYAADRLTDHMMEKYQMDLVHQSVPYKTDLEALGFSQTWEQLMALLQSLIGKARQEIAEYRSNKGWISEVYEFIDQHYGESIRLEDAAKLVHFNSNYFSQRFHQETGQAFWDYLTNVRIQKARRLFQETNFPMEKVAEKVGYPNPNYFSKVFKRTAGMTVREFKKSLIAKNNS